MQRLAMFAGLFMLAGPSPAIEPKQVFILVNRNEPGSAEVAQHYCKQRGVPAENVIVLDLPQGEDISRADYNVKLAGPVREALKDKKDGARVLLSTYGVPLRVGGSAPNAEEAEEIKKLEPTLKENRDAIRAKQEEVAVLEVFARFVRADPFRERVGELRKASASIQARLTMLERRRGLLGHAESQACVDSELMLLWWESYELRRWVVNPLYWQIPAKDRESSKAILLTSRLDGPSPDVAKRLVDDALAAEKNGLEGKVYVDARGIRYDPKTDPGMGYGGYDESMREMAGLLEKHGKLTVVLDDKPELFKPGECAECILYCGWYSHANFIDCCRFKPGAVAWHLASSEAVSLRRRDAKYWCKNLLESGACATIGPVAEPYTIGFPKPAEFFGFLATGKYSLVECYARTVMLTSWMGCLVGDPLYKPFGNNPRLKEEVIEPSPKGGRFLFRP